MTELVPLHTDLSSKEQFLDTLAGTLVALHRATSAVRLAVGTWLLEAHATFAPTMSFQLFCREVSDSLAERGVSYRGETLRGWANVAKNPRLRQLAESHGVSVVMSSMVRGESDDSTADRVETAVAVAEERGMDQTQVARTFARLPWTVEYGVPKLTQTVEEITIVRGSGEIMTERMVVVVAHDDGGAEMCGFLSVPGYKSPASRGAALILLRSNINTP